MARARLKRTAPVAESPHARSTLKTAVRRGGFPSRVNGVVTHSARPRVCTAPGLRVPCSWPRS